jgi:NAD+ synthetase
MKEIAERKTERDYSLVYEQIINQTGEYCNKYNIKSMVLGLSGGLDSTVCAAILHEVSKQYGVKLIGISLPCSTNSRLERSTAATCGDCFCDEYKEVNLQDLYLLTKAKCDTEIGESTRISQGNLKARLRMLMLYNTASINNGIVIDTDNLTEHYLGFFTIHGDVGDFKPIGKLWKTEVYELANYVLDLYAKKLEDMNANRALIHENPGEYNRCQFAESSLRAAINIKPTDGNGVTESTNEFQPSSGDLDQIAPGYTYADVDKALKFIVYNPTYTPDMLDQFVKDEFNGDIDTLMGIYKRYRNSEFKRNTKYNGVHL